MNKLTLDQFIERSKLVHGDRYDYTASIYLGINHKMSIRCRIHGAFEQSASNHLAGRGCKKCVKKTTEQFVKEANIAHYKKI